MKKIILIFCLISVCGFCSGKNKTPDWVVSAGKKYPQKEYITAVGVSGDLNSAYDKARSQIAGVFSSEITVKSLVSEGETTQDYGENKKTQTYTDVAQDIQTTSKKEVQGIEIADWWYDEENDTFYALAVLNRKKAGAILRNKISETNSEIGQLELDFEQTSDKFRRAKTAMQILDLYERRKKLDLDLKIVSVALSNATFAKETQLKPKLLKAISNVTVAVKIIGENTEVLEASVTGTLHSLGFETKKIISTADVSDAEIFLVASIIFTRPQYRFHYSRWQWSNASVTIDIKDIRKNSVFLSFTVTDRQASADFATAKNRNIKSLSKKTREKLKSELQNYFGR